MQYGGAVFIVADGTVTGSIFTSNTATWVRPHLAPLLPADLLTDEGTLSAGYCGAGRALPCAV